MRQLKVLVACEESQAVTKEFRKLGHEAFSCDIQDCSGGHPEWHIKADVIPILFCKVNNVLTQSGSEIIIDKWDLVIAHPPCTRLTNAGVRWIASKNPREGYEWSKTFNIYINPVKYSEMQSACYFFQMFLLYAEHKKIVIENPIMHSYAMDIIKIKPNQIIQPYEYGHLETKATCLWRFGVNELTGIHNVYDEMMQLPYAERAKVHYASPGKDRGKIRSKTYSGIAKAMAEQWSDYILKKDTK